MHLMTPRAIAAAVVFSLVPVATFAGIADSPLPVLDAGKPTLHVYSVPGAVAGSGLGTFFSCTSIDTVPMQVGVELFGPPGGAAFNDATSSAVGISVSSNLGGLFSKGSARILSKAPN